MKLTSITKTNTFSTVTVSDDVFGVAINKNLLSQAIKVYLANKRQGSSKVKSRGEVARTKKKWFKQKGTGNARHGARSAPIFVGGGVAHGPTGLENWSLSLSKKMKRKALAVALSAQAENIVVAESLSHISGKTKQAAAFLNAVKATDKKVLLILDRDSQNSRTAFRNIPKITIVSEELVNAYEVSKADSIICTEAALSSLQERVYKTQEEADVVQVAE